MAKILLVDDSKSIRFLLKEALFEAGHQVIEAEDGDQGLALAQAEQGGVDLVITDLSMPHKNGLDLIRDLKGQNHMIPVIGISGRASNYLALAEHLGAVKVFEKPVDLPGLLRAVAELSDTFPNGDF